MASKYKKNPIKTGVRMYDCTTSTVLQFNTDLICYPATVSNVAHGDTVLPFSNQHTSRPGNPVGYKYLDTKTQVGQPESPAQVPVTFLTMDSDVLFQAPPKSPTDLSGLP